MLAALLTPRRGCADGRRRREAVSSQRIGVAFTILRCRPAPVQRRIPGSRNHGVGRHFSRVCQEVSLHTRQKIDVKILPIHLGSDEWEVCS